MSLPPLPPPPPPPGFAAIIAQNDLKSKQPRIPWRTKQGVYRVITYTGKKEIKSADDALADTDLTKVALDSYMEHYFPEFYPLISGQNALAIAEHEFAYLDLRSEIESALRVWDVKMTDMGFLGRPFERDLKVVFQTSFDFARRRSDMVTAAALPSYEIALEAFNADQAYGPSSKAVNFDMKTTPDFIEQFSGHLSSFGDIMRQMTTPFQFNINFGVLQQELRQIINQIMTMIYDTIDPTGRRPALESTDYISVYFDESSHIVRVEYFFVNITEGNTELSKVGYMTNIKNNIVLQNPLNLNLLSNYEKILADINQSSGLLQQTDILSFLQLYGQSANAGADNPFGEFGAPFGPDSPTQPPFNNIFAGAPAAGAGAGSRLIEPDRQLNAQDFEDLTKRIKSFINYDEIAKIDKVAEDPELRSRMVQKEKAKKINAAVQVTKIIDKIATFNFPLAGPNKSKAAKIINQILTQFGIQQLVREAFICLTFGVGAATMRITGAVREALVGTDLYSRPRRPSDELNLERPSLGDFKAYFSITGDPPLGKQVLNILLNALANAGFEIIKALADLIKLNCNEILRGAPGQINAGDELQRLNNQAAQDIPELGDLLNGIATGFGFGDMGGAYDYLSEVSQILDTIELCRLLNSPSDVETSTLNKIIAFNRVYRITTIRTTLATANQIITFFEKTSQYVDTVSLCNNAINDAVEAAVASCSICLDEDFYLGLEKNAAIEELKNLMENGLVVEIPPFDFMCPDSEFFMENPVYSRILPNTFNALIDSIQIYFGGSLESARTSLLIETVTNESSPQQEAINEVVEPEEIDINLGVLRIIKDIFGKLKDGIEFIQENVDSPVCADLDLSKFPNLHVLGIALDALLAGLEASPDAIQGVVDNINAAGMSIIESTQTQSGSAARVELSFPPVYKAAFADTIGYLNFSPMDGFGENVVGSAAAAMGGMQSGSIIKSSVTINDLGSNPAYAAASLNFDFNKSHASPDPFTDDIIISYPPYSTDDASYLNLSYNIPLDTYSTNPAALPLNGSFAGGVISRALPLDEQYKTKSLNPYVYRFLTAYGHGSLASPSEWVPVATTEFPLVQAASIRKVFDYCLRNGAFNAARVQNLQLFKKNANCEPGDIGDLLDSDGIIDQMKKDFLLAMCSANAGVNITAAVRDTIKYGIINLLIQTIITQFIVKNIIVFSAFKMSDVFSPRYPIRQYLIQQVAAEVMRQSNRGGGIGMLLQSSITQHFRNLLGRKSTEEKGGITHSYSPATLVLGFTAPSYSSIGNMEKMIQFMVDERIGYIWSQDLVSNSEGTLPVTGARSTITAITNVIDAGGSKKEYGRVFLEDVVGVYTGFKQMWRDKTSGGQTTSANYNPWGQTGDWAEIHGNMGIVKEIVVDASALSPEDQTAFGSSTGTVSMSAQMFLEVFGNMTGISTISVQYALYLFQKGTGGYSSAKEWWDWEDFTEEQLHDTTILGSRLPKRLMTIPAAAANNVSTGGSPASLPPGITDFLGNVSAVTGNLIQGIKKEDYVALEADPALQLFLDQCASQNSALLIPLLYNLYLSDKYFARTTGSFNTTITAILKLLETTENTKNPPTLAPRTGSENFNNSMADPEGNNLESMAREIFLKFLKETPLQILKGLIELIDPHVAISKLIRDITADGFGMAAKGITTAIDAMPDEPPNPLKQHGATGEDVLALAFCGYNLMNQFESDAKNLPAPPWSNSSDEGTLFGPKISLNGVDFTGTVTGMFMLPPSPLGIIYLLIKYLLDQIEFPDGSVEEVPATDTTAEEC